MKKAVSLLLILVFIFAFVSCDKFIPKTDATTCKHDDPYKISTVKAKSPTCTEDGLTEGMICLNCDTMVIPQLVIPKLDCIESEWIVDAEPTHMEDGKRHIECTMCGRVFAEEIIAKKNYTLGMGVVVNTDSSRFGCAQVDATVAAVVTDNEGKIVACRLDMVENKASLYEYGSFTIENTKSKMEMGDNYGMAFALQPGLDWNGDGIVKEWHDQAKAFESYVVGMTAAEVEAMETKVVEGYGYLISADEALLSAGCTIQIVDFKEAVVKACNDDQSVLCIWDDNSTLGVAIEPNTIYSNSSYNATEDLDGSIQMFSNFASSVVKGGKIVAAINDEIQPRIYFNFAGEITKTDFTATRRELKTNDLMALFGTSLDNNNDGIVKYWYEQSAAFSTHVVGMTAYEVNAMETQTLENGYITSADDDLLTAGCTIQIADLKAVVEESVNNAR